LPRLSESSDSAAGAEVSSTSSDFAGFAAFLATALEARLGAVVSAAWNTGTGIAAAFLAPDLVARCGASSATGVATTSASADESELNDFLLDFLTARLRGDFGSIAMAPNPLARIPMCWSYAFSWPTMYSS
jgi:hypothetical protein